MTEWLAIILPAWPLQLAGSALTQAAPLAIVDGPAQRPRVEYCNALAAAAGVRSGQSLGAAQALAGELVALPRQRERERQALAELALWAYQFSPQIVLGAPPERSEHGLLIETGASARLFGGSGALHRQIRQGLRQLGHRAHLAAAPRPRAAWWLACARAHGLSAPSACGLDDLSQALEPLPLFLLDWPALWLATLSELGLERGGDLLRLPRAPLIKRLGRELLDDLDRAFGLRPDPQAQYQRPESFSATLDLPADIIDTAPLLAPAQHLMRLACGFLRGRDAAASTFSFNARHSTRAPMPATEFAVRLATPTRDEPRLCKLVAERLERVQLVAPAIELKLKVEQLLPFRASNESLVAETADLPASQDELADILSARLGPEQVFRLAVVDDHRPEFAWRAVPASAGALPPAPAPLAGGAPRPTWILTTAQALRTRRDGTPEYAGALDFLAGPERIEAGWWDPDRAPVLRDYWVARNRRGQVLWIYQDLAAGGWYLHGLFG